MLVLTFQIGSERLALDIRRVREVVPRVRLTRVSGVPEWHAGVFVHCGAVVPVVDLHRLAGAEPCPPHLSSRIVLVAPRRAGGRLIGLLAAHVVETRELPMEEMPSAGTGETGETREPHFGTLLADGEGVIRLFNPDRFLPEDYWRMLLGAPEGAAS
jgi:chemotaxis-related protein WspB